MTDDVSAPTRRPLTPAARPAARNPWITWLAVLGVCLLAIAGTILLLPPKSTDQLDGTSIVNFPALYAQYAWALAFAMLGAGLLTAWGVAGAAQWRAEHPYQAR